MKRTVWLCSALALLAACARSGDAPATDEAANAQAKSAAERPRFTVEQFRALRWLEGNWRGTLPNGGYFYESYRVVNDTIQMRAHVDSTFGPATDSSRFYFHDGTIYGGPNQVVDRIDEDGYRFVPLGPQTYSFVWKSTGPDSWTANINGAQGQIVYQMVRMPVRSR
jgi:hypothetical protein